MQMRIPRGRWEITEKGLAQVMKCQFRQKRRVSQEDTHTPQLFLNLTHTHLHFAFQIPQLSLSTTLFTPFSLNPNRPQKKERENSLPWPLHALPMWESLPWTSTSLPPASPRSQFVFFSHKALTFILSFCYVLFCKAVIFILCLVMLCVLFLKG